MTLRGSIVVLLNSDYPLQMLLSVSIHVSTSIFLFKTFCLSLALKFQALSSLLNESVNSAL